MKKQIFATCLVLCGFCLSFLHSQQVLSFRDMKKNGIFLEPFSPFTKKKELRFGYERRFRPNLALNLGFGFGLKKEDPGYPGFHRDEVSSTFTREVESTLTWILFIPVWDSHSDTPLPAENHEENDSHYLRAHQFASAELKYFLTTNRGKKLPNGLYVAPGAVGGREVHSLYHNESGSRNEIEVYDAESNTWGVPILFGSSNDSWTERVTVHEYASRTRETKIHTYLHPYARLGYQLPLGRYFTADLSALLLFKTGKEAFPEEPEFAFLEEFGFGKKKEVQKSLTLRMSYHF